MLSKLESNSISLNVIIVNDWIAILGSVNNPINMLIVTFLLNKKGGIYIYIHFINFIITLFFIKWKEKYYEM